jgi:hypothetical protein
MAMHATWDPEKRQRAFMAAGRPNLRFQELRDEVGMTERWTHRGVAVLVGLLRLGFSAGTSARKEATN